MGKGFAASCSLVGIRAALYEWFASAPASPFTWDAPASWRLTRATKMLFARPDGRGWSREQMGAAGRN
jgi:hypothetical protein